MEYLKRKDGEIHPYSVNCKNCVYFDTKKPTDHETAKIFTEMYEEKVFLCTETSLYVTESGKLPAINKCNDYREDKFLSAMREIIKKEEEEKNGI